MARDKINKPANKKNNGSFMNLPKRKVNAIERPKQKKSINSGIGLENARKRLSLIFADNYSLNINQAYNNVFTVNLNIPL